MATFYLFSSQEIRKQLGTLEHGAEETSDVILIIASWHLLTACVANTTTSVWDSGIFTATGLGHSFSSLDYLINLILLFLLSLPSDIYLKTVRTSF